jgi:hypothetical protein
MGLIQDYVTKAVGSDQQMIKILYIKEFGKPLNPGVYANDRNARRQNCMYWWFAMLGLGA